MGSQAVAEGHRARASPWIRGGTILCAAAIWKQPLLDHPFRIYLDEVGLDHGHIRLQDLIPYRRSAERRSVRKTNPKDYECAVCGRMFPSQEQLQENELEAHPDAVVERDEEQTAPRRAD
jgi:hypothetical protein